MPCFFSHQDVDTAIVSDTTDDLWFLNECPSDPSSAAVKVETVDCEEVKEGDKKVPLQTATVPVLHMLAFSSPFGAVLILGGAIQFKLCLEKAVTVLYMG